jgi:hypothetical protein
VGLRGSRHGQCDDAAFIDSAAGYAFVQMILQQGCAGAGETACAEIGNERLEAGAIGDVIVARDCGRRGGLRFRRSGNPRPDTGGGGFDDGVVNGLVADIGHGLVKFLVHATPP